jgi:broad specificity phosphatase PhoE
MKTTLLLIRHGQSAGNVENRLQGWRDSYLTPEGLEQARLLGEAIAQDYEVDVLYSSPLKRAWQTAEAISQTTGLEPIPDPDLREINFGVAEGISVHDLPKLYPGVYRAWQRKEDLDFGWPEGETRRDFHRRITDAINKIVDRHRGETVAIVSHGGVLAISITYILTRTTTQWGEYIIDNCSLTEIEIDEANQPTLVVLNQCAHEPEGKFYDL